MICTSQQSSRTATTAEGLTSFLNAVMERLGRDRQHRAVRIQKAPGARIFLREMSEILYQPSLKKANYRANGR